MQAVAEKTSFVVYADSPLYDELGNEDLGRLFRAMLAFVRAGEDAIPKDDPLRYGWLGIRHGLELDAEKWRKTRDERARAGRSGGLAKAANAKRSQANQANASKPKQNQANLANQAVTVPVPVTEPVTVPVPVTEPDNPPSPLLVSSHVNAAGGGAWNGLHGIGLLDRHDDRP